jgi:Uma2 family endonuclease
MLSKVSEYFDHGVRQVWIVAPGDRRVYVYDNADTVRIVSGTGELETPLLPGWCLPLAELFRTAKAT